MRASSLFMPTLKEDPADAEAESHRLLVRGGFVRRFAAGIYIFLPLGWRVMRRANTVIREEMNRIGAQELSMPTIHPAEVWQDSGRYYDIGPEMFRLKDRGERDMVLAMTHEEVFAWVAARELRSYRDLPQVWYQIQTKFRDEPRTKGGVLRVREFLMKDSYSFDVDEEGLETSYANHITAYDRIFARCGLTFYRVESDPGMMGGAQAHEYMAPSPAGEDRVVRCPSCGYAANIELARSVPTPPSSAGAETNLEEIDTPAQRTIEEVACFLDLPPSSLLKTLVFAAGDEKVAAVVRGDQQLNEGKLARFVGGPVRPAHPEEVEDLTGAEAGFAGPVGLGARVIVDEGLAPGDGPDRGWVTGANKSGTHLGGVVLGRDVKPEYGDIREAVAGEACPHCHEPLELEQVIEVGNIFKLGTKYSVPLGASVLDEQGRETPIVMGSYGIGPARIAAAAVEQHHDDAGIIWPKALAPFDVHVVQVKVDDTEQRELAARVHDELSVAGWECLLDDRAERPGVKFKDAELIGCPLRVTVGRRAQDGIVEVEARRGGESVERSVEELAGYLDELWKEAL